MRCTYLNMMFIYRITVVAIVILQLVAILPVFCISEGRLDLVCYGGNKEPGVGQEEAFRLDHVPVPSLGFMDLTLVLPGNWKPDSCCHRLRVEFTDKDISPESGDNDQTLELSSNSSLHVFVKWTTCAPMLTHWECIGRRNDGLRGTPRARVSPGTWSLTLLQCLNPISSSADYELVINFIPAHNNIRTKDQGTWHKSNVSIQTLSELVQRHRSPDFMEYFNKARSSSASHCLLRHKSLPTIDTSHDILHRDIGYSAPTSLHYNVEFSLGTPSNLEILRFYFIKNSPLDSKESATRSITNDSSPLDINPTGLLTENCSMQSTDLWGVPAINASNYLLSRSAYADNDRGSMGWRADGDVQTLRLSISNAWAGCTVQNWHGEPTYHCSGGWLFLDGQIMSVAIVYCGASLDINPLSLNYSLELYSSDVTGFGCETYSSAAATFLVISHVITSHTFTMLIAILCCSIY